MARTSVTTTQISKAGTTVTLVAADAVNGEVIDCGRVFLHVKNGGGSSITVTVHTTAVYDGLPVTDEVVTVPAGVEKLIGPLSGGTFGQLPGSSDVGRAYVDYSSGTSVTRAVYSL
jgi:hypothetical protein